MMRRREAASQGGSQGVQTIGEFVGGGTGCDHVVAEHRELIDEPTGIAEPLHHPAGPPLGVRTEVGQHLYHDVEMVSD